MNTPAAQPISKAPKKERKEQLDSLRAALAFLQARASPEFAAALVERKRREREWANFSRDKQLANRSGETQEQHRDNRKWYSTTQLSLEYRDAWLSARVPGKVFLDYDCGDGHETLKAARLGAALAIGIDVSNVSVANGAEAAAKGSPTDASSSKATAKPLGCRTARWT